MSDAKQLVDQVAAEAETADDDPMPTGAVATMPNKSVPVATRLALEDVAAIEALAQHMDVPVSALLRGWIRAGLTAHQDESVKIAIDRLSADLQRLRGLVD